MNVKRPQNAYVANGITCGGGKGYCFNGRCPTHDEKCKTLWGTDAISGAKMCYSSNVNGVVALSYEHLDDGTYFKCKPHDIKCGSLHCVGSNKELSCKQIFSRFRFAGLKVSTRLIYYLVQEADTLKGFMNCCKYV